MNGLHGSDDAQLREAAEVIGVEDLNVFDAMREMGEVSFFFEGAQMRIAIEYFAVGSVTNGVYGEGEVGVDGFLANFIYLIGGEKGEAKVFGCALIRLEHGCGAGAKGSIGEEFDRTDAEGGVT